MENDQVVVATPRRARRQLMAFVPFIVLSVPFLAFALAQGFFPALFMVPILAGGGWQAFRTHDLGVTRDGETLLIRNLTRTEHINARSVRRVVVAPWANRGMSSVVIDCGDSFVRVDATTCPPANILGWKKTWMSEAEAAAAVAAIGHAIEAILQTPTDSYRNQYTQPEPV